MTHDAKVVGSADFEEFQKLISEGLDLGYEVIGFSTSIVGGQISYFALIVRKKDRK